MSAKNTKSHVQRILEVHQRRGFPMGRESVLIRMVALKIAHDNLLSKQKELLHYFPVALISCVETFFKLVVKELIDHGDPYLSNAQKLMEKRYYNYEVLTSLHGQVITIGDLISHHVRVNNLKSIMSTVSDIMGFQFRNDLADVVDKYSVEMQKKKKDQLSVILIKHLVKCQRCFGYVI